MKNGKYHPEPEDDYSDETLIKMKGFDDAIIGVARQHGRPPFIVYDTVEVIRILARQFKKSGSENPTEDALEWFSYNIQGAWVGEGTPAFIEKYGV